MNSCGTPPLPQLLAATVERNLQWPRFCEGFSMNYAVLKDMLSYDCRTGLITRRDTGRVLGDVDGGGYIRIRIIGKTFLAHRLCWFLYHGEFPDGCIDHKNHNKKDNRICNLRRASIAENLRNRHRQQNNTTGFKGVSFISKTGKFRAQIKYNGEKKHLGCFATADAAHDAYKFAACKLHGEFACFN